MIDPYKELRISYDGVETDGLDEKIENAYKKTIQLYNNYIKKIYDIYPNLPKNPDRLNDIDLIEFVRRNNRKIDFDSGNIKQLEDLCSKLEKSINSVKESRARIANLDKIFVLVKTVGSRLTFACESQKRTQGYSEDLVLKTDYVPEERESFKLGDQTVQQVGVVEYTNWTSVSHSSINRYKITDNEGRINYIYANIPKQYLEDPKYVSFLSKVMLNKDYVSYALTYNGGYLGAPEKTKDGNYKLVFDNEDIAAAVKYEKTKHQKTPEDKIR